MTTTEAGLCRRDSEMNLRAAINEHRAVAAIGEGADAWLSKFGAIRHAVIDVLYRRILIWQVFQKLYQFGYGHSEVIISC